jgi:hypothetical protein
LTSEKKRTGETVETKMDEVREAMAGEEDQEEVLTELQNFENMERNFMNDLCEDEGLDRDKGRVDEQQTRTNEILAQGVLLKAGKEGHFRSRYIQVTGAHISYHSVPGAPAIDCVSFQDIVGVLYFDGHSREVQNYGRPNSSFSNSAEIIEDLEFDPFTDFLVLTSREGYFRGDVKILSCLVLEFVGIQWLNLC